MSFGRSLTYKIFLAAVLLLADADLFAIQSAGQINSDESIERVTVTTDGKLVVWNKDGQIVNGWPVSPSNASEYFVFAPRLFDTDFDGQKEVLALSQDDSGKSIFHVFRGDGTEKENWQFMIPSGMEPSETPHLGDLDGDKLLELVVPMKNGKIQIYRRDFSPFQKFGSIDLGNVAHVILGDPDNDGRTELIATTPTKIITWCQEAEQTDFKTTCSQITLYEGISSEPIIGSAIFTNFNFDGYEELLFSTANRLKLIAHTGQVLLDLPLEVIKVVSPPTLADIDLDGQGEILLVADTGDVVAFESDGMLLSNWTMKLPHRQSITPSIGYLADDRYIGGLTSSVGYDQLVFFRSQNGYVYYSFGEFAHEFEEGVELPLAKPLKIENVYVEPLVFTPNGDGINDSTRLHYELDGNALVRVEIYDGAGKLLGVIGNPKSVDAGIHDESWDGALSGLKLPDGAYRLRLVVQSTDGIITSYDAVVLIGGLEAKILYPPDDNKFDWNFPKIFGMVSLQGAAMDPNISDSFSTSDFTAYKLYHRPGVWYPSESQVLSAGQSGSGWMPLLVPVGNQSPTNTYNEFNDTSFPESNVSVRPIQNGVLGYFDTKELTNGTYTLLLKAMDSEGNKEGRIRYDFVTVEVANLSENNPYNPADPFDPANPQNPIYVGPKFSEAKFLDSSTINKQHDHVTVSYNLATDESDPANIRISVYELSGAIGSSIKDASRIVYTTTQGPKVSGSYQFVWSGATNMGWRVEGGSYRVQMEAEAVDGTGYDKVDLGIINVEKGFSSSDYLACEYVNIVNDPLDISGNITVGVEPPSVTINYKLTKLAYTTIEIYDRNPDEGGRVRKHLLDDYFAQTYGKKWYGEADTGSLMAKVSKVYVKLTARSEDIGNNETVVCKLPDISDEDGDGDTSELVYPVVNIARMKFDPTVIANIVELKGDDNEIIHQGDDPMEHAMVGNPDFLWRASGSGYVDVPFAYDISANGEETVSQRYPVPKSGALKFGYTDGAGGCVPYKPEGESFTVSYPDGWTLENYSVSFSPDTPADVFGLLQIDKSWTEGGLNRARYSSYQLRSYDIYKNTGQDSAELVWMQNPPVGRSFNVWVVPFCVDQINLRRHPQYANQPCPVGMDPGQCPYKTSLEPEDGTIHFVNKQQGSDGYIDYYSLYSGNSIYFKDPTKLRSSLGPGITLCSSVGDDSHYCGQMILTLNFVRDVMAHWGPFTSSGSSSVNSLIYGSSPYNAGTYNGRIGTIEGINPYITDTALTFSPKINGKTRSGSANRDYVSFSGVIRGWLGAASGPIYGIAGLYNSKDFYAALDGRFASGFKSLAHDGNIKPYLQFRDNKIYGWVKDLNSSRFQLKNTGYNIADWYRVNHFDYSSAGDLGLNVHIFSDIVQVTNWDIEFVYPNGEAVTAVRIKDPKDIHYNPGIEGAINRNIHDTFDITLTPAGVAKRFVSIYGNAPASYELFYFNNDEYEPRWYSIPALDKQGRAVRYNTGVDGVDLLAYWDVTYLNGEHYTVVLRAKNPINPKLVNQSTIDVAIGNKIDNEDLSQYGTKQIFTPHRRASLVFDPDVVKTPKELVTIAEVDPKSAEFILPTGAQPIGPVFDLQPEDISLCINPTASDPTLRGCSKIALHVQFTLSELEEAFGTKDYSQINLYHLADDNRLIPLFTEKHLGCKGIDLKDLENIIYEGCDPEYSQIVHFTALIDHFSQYMLVKEKFAGVELTSPKDEGVYKGVIKVSGFVYTLDTDKDGNTIKKPADLSSLKISYAKSSEPSKLTMISQSTSSNIDIDWDLTSLMGEYLLIFDVETKDGFKNTSAYTISVDSKASSSILRINGKEIKDGSSVTVSPNAIVEIVARDDTGGIEGQSGVSIIEYLYDGGGFVNYTGPFNLNDFDLGDHAMSYRTIDDVGNVEEIHSVSIKLATSIPTGDDISGVQFDILGDKFVNGDKIWIGPSSKVAFMPIDKDDLDHIEHRLNSGSFVEYIDPFSLMGLVDDEYIIEYMAIDLFGLEGPVSVRRVVLDSSSPEFSIEVSASFIKIADGYIIDKSTNITMKGADVDKLPSGLSRLEYKIGSNEWKIYDAPIRLTGPALLSFRAIDNVGNISKEAVYDMQFDSTAPSGNLISSIKAFSPNGDGIQDEAILEIDLSEEFSDSLRLIFEITDFSNKVYVLKDESVTTGKHELVWDGKINGVLLAEGNYKYRITFEDEDGNDGNPIEGDLVLDNTSPDVTVSGAKIYQITSGSGSAKDALSVDYVISDLHSPSGLTTVLTIFSGGEVVTEVKNEIDTPPQNHMIVWNGTNPSGNNALEGSYSFRIKATDEAGNVSIEVVGDPKASGIVIVDSTPPVTSVKFADERSFFKEGIYWINLTSKVGLEALDPEPGAGVNEVYYSLEAGVINNYLRPIVLPSTGDAIPLTYYSKDFVGNTETEKRIDLRVDQNPPISEVVFDEPFDDDGKIYLSPQTQISIKGEDDQSGIKRSFTMIGEDERLITQYEKPFVINRATLEDGDYVLYYWSEDNVGNVEARRSYKFYLDQTPPKTRLKLGEPKVEIEPEDIESEYYISKGSEIVFVAASEREDLSYTEYRVNDGAWTRGSNLYLMEEGLYKISYRSADQLENIEDERFAQFVVDNSSPSTAVFSQDKTVDGLLMITRDGLIELRSADNASGIGPMMYRIDGGQWLHYNKPFTLGNHEGNLHTVEYYSVDNLGNTESSKKIDVEISSIDVEYEYAVIPRVLVFMLQSIDMDDVVSRLVEDTFKNNLGKIEGFYNIVNSYGEFVEQMRSDAYNIYIFATDAHQVKFDDRPEVKGILNEIRSLVHKGDAFISLLGDVEVKGDSWQEFIKDTGQAFVYGRGRVIISNDKFDAERWSEIEKMIYESVPKVNGDRYFVGEVVDYKVILKNLANYDLSASISYPVSSAVIVDGLAPSGNIVVGKKTLNLSPDGTKKLLYLYRLGNDSLDLNACGSVHMEWQNGLAQNISLEQVIKPSGTLASLMDGVIATLADRKDAKYIQVFEYLKQLQQEIGLISQNPDAAKNLGKQVDSLLGMIESTDDEWLKFELEEILEVMNANYSPRYDKVFATTIVDDPMQDEASDTTQSIASGCSLNSNSHGINPVYHLILTLGFVLLYLKVRKCFTTFL